MRHIGLCFCCLALIPLAGWQPSSYDIVHASQDAIDRKVDSVMARMELIDKVGEMTQYTIDLFEQTDAYGRVLDPHQLDSAKLRKLLVDMRVGSILNITHHGMTLEKWHDFITTIQRIAINEKPTGIPVLYGIDAIHGANYTVGATLYPQQIGQAATFNVELVRELNRINAYETRASYIPWNFSPVMDLGRQPEWSRFWEGYGEDVYLAQQMGIAAVQGLQGEDIQDPYRVAACLKHFMGYSWTFSGKDRTQSFIPDRQLREYIMPPFQAGIDAGAATIMICSGEVNGVPVHASKRILTDLLRGEMGFKGLAVSDWADISYLHERHKVAASYKEAIMLGINAGIDMVMVPYDLRFPGLLVELVEEGKVPMSRINESVRRILRLKVELGLFDHPYPAGISYDQFASEAHAETAYQGALESTILLKNEQATLPLATTERLLVVGPTAQSMPALNGGWTHTWQGDREDLVTPGKLTIMEAIQTQGVKATYIAGTTYDESINIPAAVKAAKKVDKIVLCVGEWSYTEKPGDLYEMDLPRAQRDLWEALANTGKPLVVVLVEGRPRTFGALADKADAMLLAPLPGNEGGRAIADILFGKYNPSGRLPYNYARTSNSLEPYDHKHTDEIEGSYRPLYEFGHGLSYTTYAYSKLSISPQKPNYNDTLEISVTVANTGKMDGTPSVLVFVSDEYASITPSVRRLRAFDKISLKTGESRQLTFKIAPDQLAFVGLENKWIVEPGTFTVSIGDQQASFELK